MSRNKRSRRMRRTEWSRRTQISSSDSTKRSSKRSASWRSKAERLEGEAPGVGVEEGISGVGLKCKRCRRGKKIKRGRKSRNNVG